MKRGPLYNLHAAAGATFVESDGWEVPAAFQPPIDELTALKRSVGLADLSAWGLLRLQGSHRLDFVQRLSTNGVLGLTPGQGAPTVFATRIGRIVDLAFMVMREEDLLLIVGRGADEIVAGWLRRHIFFNDDVIVENLTTQRGLMGYSGPGAAALLVQLVGKDLSDLPLFHATTGEIDGVDVTVVRSVPLGNEYLVITPAEQAPILWTALTAAVESVGGVAVGETVLESARVGAGWPRFGRELNRDYIPLEAGLRWAISFSKGCYVGQEIIARMDTQKRLAKRLVVLGCESGSDSTGTGLSSGDAVQAKGAKVGQVTSVAPLADQGIVTALAYVKTREAEPGRELSIVVGDGSLRATVLSLPGES